MLWLCLLCRKRQEINTRYGKWVQETDSIPILTPLEKSELKWGRAQSLEEEAESEKNREFSNTPLRKRFPSQLNISLPTSSIFWRHERRQQTATLRSVVRNFIIHCLIQFYIGPCCQLGTGSSFTFHCPRGSAQTRKPSL